MTGIYCIRNRRNNKRYVGSAAKSLSKRIRSHAYQLSKGTHYNEHLQHAWDKYGAKSFVFSILEYCPSGECILREQYWIDFYNSSDRTVGYNKSPTAGSPLGYKHTEETCRKVSAGLIGKPKSKSHAEAIRLGKQTTKPSTRAKMSSYARNRPEKHLSNLSKAMKGNTRAKGRVVSKVTRDLIAEKARLRWAKWKETGRSQEVGKAISIGKKANG